MGYPCRRQSQAAAGEDYAIFTEPLTGQQKYLTENKGWSP